MPTLSFVLLAPWANVKKFEKIPKLYPTASPLPERLAFPSVDVDELTGIAFSVEKLPLA